MKKLINQSLQLIFALGVVLLIFRFILKLLGANTKSELVMWVYATSYPLIAPFLNIFPQSVIKEGFILEFTTLFAIFAYAFLGYITQKVVEIITK